MGKKSGSGSGMNIPDLIFGVKILKFFNADLGHFFGVKKLKFFDADPGSGIKKKFRFGI